jgi:hypothetical protein
LLSLACGAGSSVVRKLFDGSETSSGNFSLLISEAHVLKTTGRFTSTASLIVLALSVAFSCTWNRCEERVPAVMPTARVQADRIAGVRSTDTVGAIIRRLGPSTGLGSYFGQLSFGTGVYWFTTDGRVFEVHFV